MMATLSELSLVQATSLKLHGDVAEAHGAAAAARERLAHGTARPSSGPPVSLLEFSGEFLAPLLS